MNHLQYDFMDGLTEEEVDRWLRANDTGVLSLARDDEAYAVPVSYVFLDDSLFVRLAHEPESQKSAYVESTSTACLVVHDRFEGSDWSVVVTGALVPVGPDQAGTFDDADINELFGPLHVFDQPVEEIDVRIYELRPDSVTGRKTET